MKTMKRTAFLMLVFWTIPNQATNAATPPPSLLKSDAERDVIRAQNLLDQGRESEALLSFSDFVRRYPKDYFVGDAYYGMGEVFFRRKQYNDAIEYYRKIIKLGSQKTKRIEDAVVRVGECLDAQGKTDEAIVEWEALLRRFPKSAGAVRANELLLGKKRNPL